MPVSPARASAAIAIGLLLGAAPAWAQSPDPSDPSWQHSPPPETPSKRFSVRFSVAGRVQGLYSEPVFGGEGEVGVGARMRNGAMHVYGTLSYFRGDTRYGIDVHRPALGAAVEFTVLDRLHLGIAPQLSVVLVERLTHKELLVSLFGVGVDGLLSVDVYQGEDGDGVFLGARAGGHFQYPSAPYYGGGINVGYRY